MIYRVFYENDSKYEDIEAKNEPKARELFESLHPGVDPSRVEADVNPFADSEREDGTPFGTYGVPTGGPDGEVDHEDGSSTGAGAYFPTGDDDDEDPLKPQDD